LGKSCKISVRQAWKDRVKDNALSFEELHATNSGPITSSTAFETGLKPTFENDCLSVFHQGD
jgi:hypothetical protein